MMEIQKKTWIFSVEEINEYVRRSLTMDPMLQQVKIRGEISNLKKHSSGHWYFALKDANSRISCVMFRQSTYGVKMNPSDGKQVVLQGNVSLFVRDGSYQFYADTMEEEGTGELYKRFEALKAKLLEEGLFDQEHKKPLPLLPRRVGIVTSSTGAVVHDMIKVAKRRFPHYPMVLIPVAVQGSGAAEEIAKGIERMNQLPLVDVMIIGRGGGSIEDLWPFNEEVVARAIFKSTIPVISAVGHETDTTIADFVADVRAATPSMAAELAVPMKEELLMLLDHKRKILDHGLERKLLTLSQRLNEVEKSLEAHSPKEYFQQMGYQTIQLKEKMTYLFEGYLSNLLKDVKALQIKLEALNPLQVLDRGYAVVKKEKQMIDSVLKLQKEDQITIVFKDGEVKGKIDAVKEKKNG